MARELNTAPDINGILLTTPNGTAAGWIARVKWSDEDQPRWEPAILAQPDDPDRTVYIGSPANGEPFRNLEAAKYAALAAHIELWGDEG